MSRRPSNATAHAPGQTDPTALGPATDVAG
jgi:hypothetical protein